MFFVEPSATGVTRPVQFVNATTGENAPDFLDGEANGFVTPSVRIGQVGAIATLPQIALTGPTAAFLNGNAANEQLGMVFLGDGLFRCDFANALFASQPLGTIITITFDVPGYVSLVPVVFEISHRLASPDSGGTALARGTKSTDTLSTEIAAVDVGAPSDVDLEPVPSYRTARLLAKLDLDSESPIKLSVGDKDLLCAVDFSDDLPRHGRIFTFDSLDLAPDSAAGLAVGATLNRDRASGKFRLTATAAGAFTLLATVTYAGEHGERVGKVRVVVGA